MRMCLTEAAVSPGMVGEHTNGSYVVICMLMCVGEESTGAGPCFHRALLPEQPPESCWWFAKHVTCSLMRQLTRRRGGEGDKRVEVLKKRESSLFGRVDILQGTSVYSGWVHGAPLCLGLLLQVVL